jgi:hypothetical protein
MLRRPWYGVATVLLVAVLPATAAYLPVVGPAPIRLQAPPKPPSLLRKHLPLPVPASTVDTSAAPLLLGTNAADASESSETITVKSPAPESATNVLGALPAWPTAAAQTETLTPQMLVPFFYQQRPAPGGKDVGVAGSLIFSPPQTQLKPMGKATLKTE